MESTISRIETGFERIWISLVSNTLRPTVDEVKNNLVTGLSDHQRKFIIELDNPPFNGIEIARAIFDALRLFYKQPLILDSSALDDYFNVLKRQRLEGTPHKLRNWREFVTSEVPPTKPMGLMFPEGYVWNVLHYIAAIPSEDAWKIFTFFSINLINLLGCSICQLHLKGNWPLTMQLRTNILIASVGSDKYDKTFFASCIFHDGINDVNKGVAFNVCRTCPLGCRSRLMETATELRLHRQQGYERRLSEYRAIASREESDIISATV